MPQRVAACLCVLLASIPVARSDAQTPFLRGDVNDDGRVSISDAHSLSLWLYGDGLPPPCLKAADATDDGEILAGGLRGQFRDDLYTILFDPLQGAKCSTCYAHTPLAEPRLAPDVDPTDDDLACASYTGKAPPENDPEAKLEVLDARCPGGKDALAVVKVRISTSHTIGGYSGVFDGAGVLAQALEVVDVAGAWAINSPRYAAVRDERVYFGYLDADDLGAGYPDALGIGFMPPVKDQVALKIYLRVEPGTPAGKYPLLLEDGEMADSLTGRAIAPALADGLLTVENDVAFDAAADLNVAGHAECRARETTPPSGPEDVQVSFDMAVVPAERGAKVTVPLWIESNAPVEGFTFAIGYGYGPEALRRSVRLTRVVPLEPAGRPWEVFEYEINPDLLQVYGTAIFSRADPTAALPPGVENQVLLLELDVDAGAPDGKLGITCDDVFGDPARPGTRDWQTAVRAYGRFLNKGQLTCLERYARSGGIILGENTKEFVRGDANADGAVSLADAVVIGHTILRGEGIVPCLDAGDAGDADDNGGVDFSDAILIFKHLFEVTPHRDIPPPFPAAGRDATLDPLTCEVFQVSPARRSGDSIRIGSVDALPGEFVDVPIYASTSLPFEACEVLVRFDPGVFTPLGGVNAFRIGGAFAAAAERPIQSVLLDLPRGRLAVGFVPDLVRPPGVPAGSDILLGTFAGLVSEVLQPGDEVRIEPVEVDDRDPPAPDRLRTEVVESGDGKPTAFIPKLEAGVIRIVDGDEATFIRGDANFDLEVNISDAVFTLAYLFLGGPAPPCEDAADADDTGELGLTDAVFTLNFLFSGGARPLPSPYPFRGRDGEKDGLAPCRDR